MGAIPSQLLQCLVLPLQYSLGKMLCLGCQILQYPSYCIIIQTDACNHWEKLCDLDDQYIKEFLVSHHFDIEPFPSGFPRVWRVW